MCQHSDPRSSATLPTANGTHGLRRESGKCILKWTSRFEGFVKRTGAALHQADANIDADTFLHPLILGIMLLECSRLTPAENAAVLATSGATTKEGSTIGNSYLFKALVARFGAQWDDEAIQRRDRSSSHRRAAHFWPLTRHRGSTGWSLTRFSKTEKMLLKHMIGMLILMSTRRTMATTMNRMWTFHQMAPIWRNMLDLWKWQKGCPRQKWEMPLQT